MSLDASIHYKDSSRPTWSHPFCPQSVLRDFWWPIAEKHGLQLLQRMECLFLEDRDEAEQMVNEFRFVEGLLRAPDHAGLSADYAASILDRLAIALNAFEGALAEWQNVDYTAI